MSSLMGPDGPAEQPQPPTAWTIYLRTPDAADTVSRAEEHGAGEAATAGLCEASSFLPAGTPSYWRIYFSADDVDAALQTVTRLGGAVLDGPMGSPFGRLAAVADPQGASFQIIEAGER